MSAGDLCYPPDQRARPAKAILSASMRSCTILAIDDSKKILTMVKSFLRTQGYLVKTRMDPARGIQVAKQGTIDLILLDIMMPKMDGYRVFDALKQDPRTREIPVIMLTARAIIWNTPKDFFYGLYGFLAKPFSKWDLRKVVKEALRLTHTGDQGRFISSIEGTAETGEPATDVHVER
jgi:CheY-like chemotaxis protein